MSLYIQNPYTKITHSSQMRELRTIFDCTLMIILHHSVVHAQNSTKPNPRDISRPDIMIKKNCPHFASFPTACLILESLLLPPDTMRLVLKFANWFGPPVFSYFWQLSQYGTKGSAKKDVFFWRSLARHE